MSQEPEPRIVNLSEQFDRFEERWAPKIVARYNDNEVRLVKTEGEWIWHSHPETDELFLSARASSTWTSATAPSPSAPANF